MAGKTKIVIGLVRDTLDATGQPILMVNDIAKAKEPMIAMVADAKKKPEEKTGKK